MIVDMTSACKTFGRLRTHVGFEINFAVVRGIVLS
jgi:hypothetical protein